MWLDPRFLETCPSQVRYATGMDAFTQLLESYTTRKANPFTDALAWQGMQLFQSVKTEFLAEPLTPSNDLSSHLMLAASFSGMTLANAGLGAVHGLAGPIGAFFEAPHGEVCAALLAPITEANINALQDNPTPEANQTLYKYAQIGQLFNPDAQTQTQTQQLSSLTATLTELSAPIQGLSAYGLSPNNLKPVLENCRAGSMLGNPIELSDSALYNVMLKAL